MGNTIASGRGYLLEVGKNCEKVTQFTSDVIITFKGISIYKIAYNNSKFGKACLAGTQDRQENIIAQNKYFNFQWNVYQDDVGNFVIIGNHTKKCDKNSVALVEYMDVLPAIAEANKEKLTAIAKQLDKNSELAKHIYILRNNKL